MARLHPIRFRNVVREYENYDSRLYPRSRHGCTAAPRFRIEQAARNPPIPRRFVDIRLDELRLVRNRIVRVQIFPIDQAIGGTGQNFLRGYSARFVAWVEHAITPKVTAQATGASGL